jgi:uncharacterized membrane protein
MNSHDSEQPSEGRQHSIASEIAGDPSLFTSLTGHFYRGEIERMVGWRSRLDQTTNWAVVLMAAILTFTFSSQDNPHYVLLVGALAVGAFLVIESQRYQEYDVWRHRVRLFQQHFIADVTSPTADSESDWREELGDNLREPTLTIPFWQALAHRLKHVYLFLFTILLAAWALRITVFESGEPWTQTARIADLSGTLVAGGVGAVYLSLCALALWSFSQSRLREF